MTWTVVVPVKVATAAKTRLAGDLSPAQRVALVRAMAVDTVAAARATPLVSQVLVVTDDPDVDADLHASGRGGTRWASLLIVPEPSGARGLNGAIAAGIARARADRECPVAVLLGDLPALRPVDLAEALRAAASHPLAVVVDADATGTTLITAAAGAELHPAFGEGSAAEHLRRGHVALDVPAGSGLRQDVDVLDDLAAVSRIGPGSATARVLRALVPGVRPSVA